MDSLFDLLAEHTTGKETFVLKMPWLDVNKCTIAEHCDDCKAARSCKYDAFNVVPGYSGSGKKCRIAIDMEKCHKCGECMHACELGAVKMI